MLLRAYNAGNPQISVTLVESPRIGRIGVGEATTPTIRRLLAACGIDEESFLRRTGATFKHGIRFIDWSLEGESYFHPFEAFAGYGDLSASVAWGEEWLTRRAHDAARPFAYDTGVQASIADALRAPKRIGDPSFAGRITYAYHLDADLLGDLLLEKATEGGAEHVRDDVVEARRDATSGNIVSLLLGSGREIAGDFFVDCSGFVSLLLGKTLGVPFQSFGQHLLCDRAVALRLPHQPEDIEIDPATTARALPSGWMWRIGLQERSGNGYVYSSAFISDDEAESELRRMTKAPDSVPARILKMRTGRSDVSWHKNCVAVGLSGGFIEPLESTGIHLIEDAARQLCRLLPVRGPDPAATAMFNRYLAEEYDEVRDFVVLHYCLTRRRSSPFWQAVVQPEHIPERVRHLLELWRSRAPAEEDLETSHIFSAVNHQFILYGMNWTPQEALDRARRRPLSGLPPEQERRRAELLACLPRHREYLQAVTASTSTM